MKLPLVWLFGRWRGRCWPGGAAWGRESRRRSSVLLLNLSDTAATSQDGSYLEFIAPIAVGSAIFRMQVAEGCAHCSEMIRTNKKNNVISYSLSIL